MKRPNILILCPDEMKATALGAYGNRAGATPFIDRWASRAAVFEQCHTVHPKCTPSRCAFTSSQYPHVGGHRTLDLPLRRHETNLLRALRDAGYYSVLAGKNHTADAETMPSTFDHWIRVSGKVDFTPKPELGFPEGSYQIGEAGIALAEFSDRRTTLDAINWLENQRDATRPFCLWVNWNAPHPPYSVPAPYYGCVDRTRVELPPADDPATKPPYHRALTEAYDCGPGRMNDAQWREVAATYLDLCRFVDDQVKDVLAALARTGEAENTLAVLWSDHGDFAGEHRLSEKWDTSFYDCITRVPLFMSGPGIPVMRTAALVETIDILPTLLAAAGVAPPPGIQGCDLGPLLRGEVSAVRSEVFCQGGQEDALLRRAVPADAKPRPAKAYFLKQLALHRHPLINRRAKMIRDQRWKYIYHSGGFEELYDLETDPHELTNLACGGETPELSRYRMRLMQKLIEVETVEPHQAYLEA